MSTKSSNIKKAQAAARSPEARAKAAATMKRRRAEKEAALLAHAKMVTKEKEAVTKDWEAIPLDMIPDRPKRKYVKRATSTSTPAKSASRREVVLALLKYLNDE